MLKYKSILAVIIALSAAISVMGCTQKSQSPPLEVSSPVKELLNERQRQILKESGLPEEFEELELSQQYSIKAIDEMLSYMEDKYDKTFCYCGYIPSGILDDEQLFCYEEGTSPDRKITVVRNYEDNEPVYTDDYPEIVAGEKYAEQLSEKLSDMIGENDFLLISQIKELPEGTTDEDLLDKASALTRVFVSSENCSKEQHKETADRIYGYLSDDKGFAGEIWYYLVDKDTFSKLTPYNTKDMLSEHGFEDTHTIKISRTGEDSIEYHH